MREEFESNDPLIQEEIIYRRYFGNDEDSEFKYDEEESKEEAKKEYWEFSIQDLVTIY